MCRDKGMHNDIAFVETIILLGPQTRFETKVKIFLFLKKAFMLS